MRTTEKQRLWGIPAILALVFALVLAACPSSSGSGGDGSSGKTPSTQTPDPLTMTGTSIDGDTIEVVISRTAPRAVLAPQNNDYYVIKVNGAEISRGRINVSDSTLIFTPNSGETFNGSLNGSSMLIAVIPGSGITGIMASSTGSGSSAPTEFNVTSTNFDSTIKGISAPGEYVINLSGDLTGYTGFKLDKPGVKITVKGTGTNKISWTYQEGGLVLFEIRTGCMILKDITLERAPGNNKDNKAVIDVHGMLVMEDGVTVNGRLSNGNRSDVSGVFVGPGGHFVMRGGTIKGNGAGIGTDEKGVTIAVTGGTITDNSHGIGFFYYAENPGNNRITMTGGTVSGNSGFGLMIQGPASGFLKTGGIIYGTSAGANSNEGGAIKVETVDGANDKILTTDALASEVFAATTNADATDIVPSSLKGNWD